MGVLQKVVGVREKERVTAKKAIRQILVHLCYGTAGVLFSMSGFNGDFSPFGIAYAASVPKDFTVSASLGAAAGYFIALDSLNGLRYTSSILALCVIMSALRPFRQLRDNPYTPVAVVFVCLSVTGSAIIFSEGASFPGIVLVLAESVISAASSVVFTKSIGVLSVPKGMMNLTSKSATAMVISFTVLLLSLRSFSVAGVYPVHIIALVIILVCAYYGREAGGAIVGICSGIAMSLGTTDLSLLAYYSLGGLLAGAFSSLGRVASFLAFSLSGIAVVAIGNDFANVLTVGIETVISGVVFILLTKVFDLQLESVFLPSVSSPVAESIKNGIISKLKKASETSAEICTSLTDVNRVLEKTDKTDINKIGQKTKEQICGSCGLYDSCWRESVEVTKKNFEALLDLKKNGVYLEYKTVPQQFASFCIRSENVASNFNRLYSEYRLRESNQSRVKEIYNLAAEQFVNVSALLDSLCDDINDEVKFDMELAAAVRSAAVACGFGDVSASCVVNSMEKMTLEVTIKVPYDKTEIKNFGKQINLICKRRFELPEIENYGTSAKLIYREKYEYKIVSAGVQFNANGEKYSGDSFTTFQDDKGYFYAIICDGMGTGTKAALSSNLAVSLLEKLIKSGFGINASVNTVNTSLISKSGEECSVTLDMVVFDLFTGRTEFYKCGAADTAVKRNGKIVDVGFCSLPLGILGDCEPGSGNGMLSCGDVIVMHSDGVREEDEAYLKKQLKKFDNGNVRNFTAGLCENIRRSQPEKNDDMTVLTLAVTKND